MLVINNNHDINNNIIIITIYESLAILMVTF